MIFGMSLGAESASAAAALAREVHLGPPAWPDQCFSFSGPTSLQALATQTQHRHGLHLRLSAYPQAMYPIHAPSSSLQPLGGVITVGAGICQL